MALYENKLLIPVIWYVILFCSSNNVDFIINIFFVQILVSLSVWVRANYIVIVRAAQYRKDTRTRNMRVFGNTITLYLTEVAGEGGPDLAPQKFLLSQKFRHLMRCIKYLKKFFLSCLVSEIQLFFYIFRRNSKWPPEVRKRSPVKFFEVSYYQNFF